MLLRPSARLLPRQSCIFSPSSLSSSDTVYVSQCRLLLQSRASRSYSFRPVPQKPQWQQQQRRNFILPTPPAQTFTATRRIAYPPPALFKMISDVDSYSKFVPFCTSSVVTESSAPPEEYPVKANLRVGWGGFDETFTSRLQCSKKDDRDGGRQLDGGVVEADATENSIFEVLRARWVIDGVGAAGKLKDDGSESKVELEIEYKFANPLYAALSEAVMPSVAGKIIQAFETRAEGVLGKSGKP